MNQLLIALTLCSAELGGGRTGDGRLGGGRPCCDPPGGVQDGEMSFTLINRNDPCYRGTMFDALKVVKSYRDNQGFAYHHFEGRRLQISGRLVVVRKDIVTYTVADPTTGKPVLTPGGAFTWTNEENVMEVLTAVVTPDGKPPLPQLQLDGTIKPAFGLEFRFPLAQLKDKPDLRCAVAALWAGQYVTLKGDCRGAVTEGDYTAIIFENAEIVK